MVELAVVPDILEFEAEHTSLAAVPAVLGSTPPVVRLLPARDRMCRVVPLVALGNKLLVEAHIVQLAVGKQLVGCWALLIVLYQVLLLVVAVHLEMVELH